MKNRLKKAALMLAGFFFFFDTISWLTMVPVHAYIDPSAVTYVIQATAGILIAIGAEIAIFRHCIFAFIRGRRHGDKKTVKEPIVIKDGVESLDEIPVELV